MIVPGPLFFWKATIVCKTRASRRRNKRYHACFTRRNTPESCWGIRRYPVSIWNHGVMQWCDRIVSWSCGATGATGDSRSLVFTRTPLRLQNLSPSVRNWNEVSDFCNCNNSKNFNNGIKISIFLAVVSRIIFFSQWASGRYPPNPAFWLVPGADNPLNENWKTTTSVDFENVLFMAQRCDFLATDNSYMCCKWKVQQGGEIKAL